MRLRVQSLKGYKMDVSQQLQTAYEIAKSGDRPKARQLVKEVLEVEPKNDAAWYLYAKIAGDRQKSIDCLEKVLEINPSHTRARQDLERLKLKGTTFPNPKEHDLRTKSGAETSNKKRSTRLPGWLWAIIAGFSCTAVVACLGFIVFSNTLLPHSQPSISNTEQPLVFSTPTNDCTCFQATSYLENTFARVDKISAQIISIESAFEDSTMFELNFAVFSSEAKAIYKEQLAEVPPSCLQAFQNKTVSLLWNWQQTMEYAATGQYNAADLFIQGFLDDFSALESEGKRLLEEELNGCIMDPGSGPNL
jgi:tetratricopeptide (TPR) repeat protein